MVAQSHTPRRAVLRTGRRQSQARARIFQNRLKPFNTRAFCARRSAAARPAMRLGGQDLAPPSQPGQMDRGRLQRIALMAVGALMAGAPLFPFTVSFAALLSPRHCLFSDSVPVIDAYAIHPILHPESAVAAAACCYPVTHCRIAAPVLSQTHLLTTPTPTLSPLPTPPSSPQSCSSAT